jgi:hypothetical protein
VSVKAQEQPDGARGGAYRNEIEPGDAQRRHSGAGEPGRRDRQHRQTTSPDEQFAASDSGG